jgi:NADH-quinone oxidoreductase subunit G
VPRQTHRYSGRTAMYANRTMHEPKAQVDTESPLAFSMEGANTGDVGALIPYVWAPGWNSNQAITRFQLEVGGRLRGGDPGVRVAGVAGRANNWPEAHADIAASANPREFRLQCAHELFGSDELSALSPPIRERMAAPYVVLNPRDAARLGVAAGGGVRGTGFDKALEVRIDAALPEGTAVLPRGLAGRVRASAAFERDPNFAPPVRIIARQSR